MRLFALLAILFSLSRLHAGEAVKLALPSFFSENMVLQRDVPIPVWGRATDGETITVVCGDQKVQTVAKDGRWRVMLEPLKAGGPYTLAVMGKNPNDTILFSQVLVGEVWIVCGQSNALMPITGCEGIDDAIAKRMNYPDIRVVELTRRDTHMVKTPEEETYSFWGGCKWESGSYLVTRQSTPDKPQSQTIPGAVSGLGYFFARELSDYFERKIPVGIIQMGAILTVQSWVDDETAAQTPMLAPLRGKGYPNSTSRAFNAQVAPLAPFPVRGVIYYQGEMNAGPEEQAFYQVGLQALISSWRKAWNDPKLPFLIVQLSGFIKNTKKDRDERLDMDAATLAALSADNVNHGFCAIREAQLQTWRNTPGVGVAVTFDVGDPGNIHPRKKLPVAQRLILQARKMVYGDASVVADSPYPTNATFNDNSCLVEFAGIGGGLVAKGGELKGFELSPDGTVFRPANAALNGSTITITSSEVKKPVAVRYAWAGWPEATLYNAEGLPATPFCLPQKQSTLTQK